MGTIGCPLCCQQDFESVGTLQEHLIYYIYRPLQCSVCCLHLAGIHEFTRHLRCHLGDELARPPKLSHVQPSLPSEGVPESQTFPLPLATAPQDGVGVDSDVGTGTAYVSDEYSSYMKGSDAANQLLKLREWRLEKLGKNFSRHRVSFGKSPELLELSPSSGRIHRNSPSTSVRESTTEGRPSSHGSSYTTRSDILPLNKDIGSVESCDPFATPTSVYGNVGSVELFDDGVCPQSMRKEVNEEIGFHSPRKPLPTIQETSTYSSDKTTPGSVKGMGIATPTPVERLANTSTTSESEVLHQNLDFQSFVVPESNVSRDDCMNHQARSVQSSLPCVSTTKEGASSSFHSSRNEYERITNDDVYGNNFTEPLTETHVTEDNETNTDHYESDSLPVPLLVNSDLRQYHELQPVPISRQEGLTQNLSRLTDVCGSCPDNSSLEVYEPLEAWNKSSSKITKDTYMSMEFHYTDTQNNCSNKVNAYTYLSSNTDEGSILPEVINTGEKPSKNIYSDDPNLDQDDTLKRIRNQSYFPDAENCSALNCSAYESQTGLESACEGAYSLVDNKPYFHKKFHHDQERKMLPSTAVDQVADVSQYINSFQSVLVRKLNGTLSNNIPITSSICSVSMTKPEEDHQQVSMEEPHQPQTKEYICEFCHKMFQNLETYHLHCNDHEKEKDDCSKDLDTNCTKDPCKKKPEKRKEKFQCDQCSKTFPKAFSISRHMREVHAVKKSFTCVQCNKAFCSKRQLQEHSRVHNSVKVHKCLQCNHQCYTASGLRTHIQEIHSLKAEQRVHSCDICEEKFAKAYGLKRHKQRKHGEPEQQLTCNICSKNFTCKEDLNKHTKTHSGSDTLKCDICDKTFTTSWALQRHANTHQSSPLHFKCHICNMGFTRKDSLVSHLHAHSQRKYYVCHCGKRFVKKSQLKEHQIKHSNVAKYTCSVCKHSFKFKVSLKNHSCKKKIVQT